MHVMRINVSVLLFCMAVFASVLSWPLATHAMSEKANTMCALWNPACPCKAGIKMDPQTGTCPGTGNTAKCEPGVCFDDTATVHTDGICVAVKKCKGVTSKNTAGGGGGGQSGAKPGGGQDGGQPGGKDAMSLDASSLSKLGEMIQGIMGKLGGGGGGGGGGMPPGGGQGGGQGSDKLGSKEYGSNPCSAGSSILVGQSFKESIMSADRLTNINTGTPCSAYGNSSVSSLLNNGALSSDGIGTANQLLNTLNGGDGLSLQSSSGVGAQILSNLNNLNTNINGTTNADASAGKDIQSSADLVADNNSTILTEVGVVLPGGAMPAVRTQGGVSGNLQAIQKGAILVFSMQNGGGTVAGFYGGNTIGSTQPQSVIVAWCENRPWTTNFLSKIVSPTFFDGLCKWSGYQVGKADPVEVTIPKTPKAKAPVKSTTKVATTSSATTTPSVPPKVAIWAVPTVVPIGARTTIYWNTQGVTSCKITSPDGSFTQNSVSGGAATVPLTAPTTFTISCLASGDTPVTSYVTVQIAN